MDIIIIIGLLAATGTTIAQVPQFIKSYKTHHTKDVSLWMYVILTTGIFLWIVYGFLRSDIPIILANMIVIVLTSSILVMKIKNG
jgi:MtN3 and saliva related transmembrane protein